MAGPAESRASPLWRGPQKAAQRWRTGLGADPVEVLALRHGVLDLPNRPVEPFRQESYKDRTFSSRETDFADETIRKRLARGSWIELTEEQAAASQYMSNEFITTDSSGNMRAVADLKYLSSFWDARLTKCDTLESNAPQLKKEDQLISFDLESGYHQFRLHPTMRKWFVVKFAGRWFQYVALPFGWRLSGYWFVRLVGRFTAMLRRTLRYRVLQYVDDFLVAPSVGRHSTRRDCLRASKLITRLLAYYGIKRHPEKGIWGGGTTCIVHLGFVIDTVRCTFGVPAVKLEKVSSMAKRLMMCVRRNRRQAQRSLIASFVGVCASLSLAVPDARFFLRGLHDCLSGSKATSSRLAVLSHAAIRELRHWSGITKRHPHRPIWPRPATPAWTMHTDSSMESWGATLQEGARGPGNQGLYEVHGHWDSALQRTAHITLLELRTVRESLQKFSRTVKFRKGDVLQLYTDNQVCYYVISMWMSRSPAVMTELRLLHRYLWDRGIRIAVEHLPSALNLYADRLSRHRKAYDFLPRLSGVLESTWVGASEHDWSKPWPERALVRPPLEYLPLVARKAVQDRFQGLMLVPRWTRRLWWPELEHAAYAMIRIPPGPASCRKWDATLVAFSAEADQDARKILGRSSLSLSWQRPVKPHPKGVQTPQR